MHGDVEHSDVTHLCTGCRKELCDSTWPYAACEKCGKECRHGSAPEDCDACYVESDFAYDAARETGR